MAKWKQQMPRLQKTHHPSDESPYGVLTVIGGYSVVFLAVIAKPLYEEIREKYL